MPHVCNRAGGIGNVFASSAILEDYRRWGYPEGFQYVTGLLELMAAGLILREKSRIFGTLLGASIMLAAAATVLVNGETSHAIPPAVVLIALTLVGFAEMRRRRAD